MNYLGGGWKGMGGWWRTENSIKNWTCDGDSKRLAHLRVSHYMIPLSML